MNALYETLQLYYMKCYNLCGIFVCARAQLSRPRHVAVFGSNLRFPTHAIWHRVHVERAAWLPHLAALHIIVAKHVV